MDPNERFHRRNLRDILVSQGTLTAEQAEELVASARENHELLSCVLVESGYVTAWDLVKTVAASYQMPIMPLAEFDFDRKLLEGLSPTLLYQYQVLPVGRFGRAWSFAVVEPPTRELIDSLRSTCGNSIFFFAAEAQDVRRLLKQHVKVVDVSKDKSWESIFDVGEEAVQQRVVPAQPETT